MSKIFTASLLVLGVTFAMPSVAQQTVSGALRTTATPNTWQWKYLESGGLGGQNICNGNVCHSNEAFDWQSGRTYNNGILNTAGYQTAVTVPVAGATNDVRYWNKNFNWIGTNRYGDDRNGFYSYVTTINDTNSLPADDPYVMVTFTGLSISFAADDHLEAIFINGVRYDGFAAQDPYHRGWEQTALIPLWIPAIDDFNWNVSGNNTVEFIVHNNNSPMLHTTAAEARRNNPTGLAASVQAHYQTTVVPEPETWAMLLAGLGIVGAVARRRKKAEL
jgi:hypothetical protein